MTVQVDIITPERQTFSEKVDAVVVPGIDGEIGILANHTPLLAQLGIGQIRLRKGDQIQYLAVSGGFVEVQKGSRVSVFAETAELSDEIDAERARQAAERAKAQLQNPRNIKDVDVAEAEAALNRALIRLKVANIAHKRAGHIPSPQEHLH